jgi:hypothetical protein
LPRPSSRARSLARSRVNNQRKLLNFALVLSFCTITGGGARCKKRKTDPHVTAKAKLRRAFLLADIEFLFCASTQIPSSTGAQLLASTSDTELFFFVLFHFDKSTPPLMLERQSVSFFLLCVVMCRAPTSTNFAKLTANICVGHRIDVRLRPFIVLCVIETSCFFCFEISCVTEKVKKKVEEMFSKKIALVL